MDRHQGLNWILSTCLQVGTGMKTSNGECNVVSTHDACSRSRDIVSDLELSREGRVKIMDTTLEGPSTNIKVQPFHEFRGKYWHMACSAYSVCLEQVHLKYGVRSKATVLDQLHRNCCDL